MSDVQETGEQGFEKLRVWITAMEVAEEMYAIAETLPASERFGMLSQIQRAAVSIPTNISEGWGRGKGASNLHFARIARGSLYELKTLLYLMERTKKGDVSKIVAGLKSLESLRRILQAYISAMENQIRKSNPRQEVNEEG